MGEYADNSTLDEDPFILLSTKAFSERLMEESKLLLLKGNNPNEYSQLKAKQVALSLPGYGRHYKIKEEKVKKFHVLFLWGMGGGLALIGPMLLMRLHRTLATQLATTCVSVMLFAILAALLASKKIPWVEPIDLEPKDLLTAVAAYAAVLVVFVSQGS
jgi:hypothetical protein